MFILSLNANDDILFFNKDFSKITFFANEMGILGVDPYKINLDDDNNFYDDYLETIIHVRLLAWRNKFEKWKAPNKISRELTFNVPCIFERKVVMK